MRREAEKYLKEWISSKHRKPLIIRGARQVGKSTLVRNFAKNQKLDLFELNLELHPKIEIFKSFDVNNIIRDLEVLINQKITSDTLIFIDEIQKNPAAISALRYFYENRPEIPIIAAGSLLEIVLEEMEYSMPVGRIDYLYLGPMTFYEFLKANNDEVLLQNIESQTFSELSKVVFNKLVERYREFLFVGGMPEAVLSFVETNSGHTSQRIHQSIIETYLEDFSKYKKHVNIEHLEMVFNYVSTHVGQKIKYSNISHEHQSRELKKALNLLIKARVILPVYCSSCSAIPLKAGIKPTILKPYFLDVGLMNYQYGLNWNDFSSLTPKDLFNIGASSEQFVAQHLMHNSIQERKPEAFYWLREKKSSSAEVDFVISLNGEILPLEIKSGKSGALKSLHQFLYRKKMNRAIRLDLNNISTQTVTASVKVLDEQKELSFTLDSMPIFLIESLLSQRL